MPDILFRAIGGPERMLGDQITEETSKVTGSGWWMQPKQKQGRLELFGPSYLEHIRFACD